MGRFRETLLQGGKPLFDFSKIDNRTDRIYRFFMLTTRLRQHLINAAFNPIKAALYRSQLCTYSLEVRCDEILNYISHVFDCSHNSLETGNLQLHC
jgi:hypothetical protein